MGMDRQRSARGRHRGRRPIGLVDAAVRRAVHRLTRGVGDTVFYGADGKPWFRLDEQRHDVPLYDIAADLQHAVVAVEDRRFYSHPGIDPIGVARARCPRPAERGPRRRRQHADAAAGADAVSVERPHLRPEGEGSLIALLIEVELTKDQILELYLNRVYLSAGVYGVEAMSEHLFRKPAKELTLPEAALIAGLLRAPSALSPWTNYEGALQRSRTVLGAMREQRFITPEQEQQAREVRPRIQPYRSPRIRAPAGRRTTCGSSSAISSAATIRPTGRCRPRSCRRCRTPPRRPSPTASGASNRPGLEVALVALDPSTGDVLAMVGGADYARSTFNRATRGRRQPGSAFKPLVYTAALASGLSPVSVLTIWTG